ncbi:MAG TPA: vitamin K epoxide reductase family protein [Sphingomicrobium sp.]|nr:vitamin K epoxide reductase family protein [Sphingomicrobium sp.]
MRQFLMQLTSGDLTPIQLQDSIRNDDRPEMRYRRSIVGVSLVGMAAMGIVALLQTGIVRKLPEPHTKRPKFDTLKVNTSKEAFSYGMPDGALVLVTHAANLALAAAGPADRYERRPWLPIAALASALPQALVAAKYLFYQMPRVDKAWCPYCVVDALTHFATLGLAVPEALGAFRANSMGTPRRQSTRRSAMRPPAAA